MLVISRKANQAICFPKLGITVRVTRTKANGASLAIDAPQEFRILREELLEQDASSFDEVAAEERHARRNELNKARLGLALAQKQLETGRLEDAESSLSKAIRQLGQLEALAGDSRAQSKAGCSASSNGCSHDGPNDGPKMRALVVEDNDNERELLAGYLRLSGFQVVTASTGLEAIEYLAAARDDLPEAVFLDMKMPILNGAETVEQIRLCSDFPDIKLFAVSGFSPDEMSVPVGPKGVDRWFSKPVDPAELVQQICSDMDQQSRGGNGRSDRPRNVGKPFGTLPSCAAN